MNDNIVIKCNDIQELRLLDLNDHCLLKVCEYLKVADLMNFDQTCERLRNVAKMAAIKYTHFSLWQYNRYKAECNLIKKECNKAMEISKILNFIAPHLVSLDLLDCGNYVYNERATSNGLLLEDVIKALKFKKLKTLDLKESCQLKWINGLTTLEELRIRRIQEDISSASLKWINELMTLKKLTIGRVHEDISSDELRRFLEKISHIERLTFYLAFPSQFPYNVLPKLRRLRKLSVVVNEAFPDWMQFLQIEQLSDLTIESRREYDISPMLNFLTILASKKILTRIELRRMHFDEKLFNVVSLLNVTNLRIVMPVGNYGLNKANLYLGLANTTLSNLTDLDILEEVDDKNTLRLIKHFEHLETLTIFNREKYNRQSFLAEIPYLFHWSTRSRPTLMLINYHPYHGPDNVMIDFCNRRYKVNVNHTIWNGPVTKRSRMFTNYF